MEVKKDCFAFNGTECSRLTDTFCKKGKCRFYICQEEFEARQKETEEKLKRSGYYVGKISKNIR